MDTQKNTTEPEQRIKKRYILTAVSAIFALGLVVFAISSEMIPAKYMAAFTILLAAIYLEFALLQRKWRKICFGIIAVLEVLLIGISCYGMSVFYHASHMVHEITEIFTETDSISAYVLADSSWQSLQEAAESEWGRVEEQSPEAVAKVLFEVFGEKSTKQHTTEFADMFLAADALRSEEVGVLLLNDAYAGLISEIEGYEWFEEETKVLESFLVDVEVEKQSGDSGQTSNNAVNSDIVQDNTDSAVIDNKDREKEEDGSNKESAGGQKTEEGTGAKDEADAKEGNQTGTENVQPIMELMEAPEQVDWNALVGQDMLEVPEGSFIIYISGVDTWGSVSAKSRSDVNILAVVNTNTKKVLLVSTPRDYYVPLSVSNGVKDKLTHAGIYGIDSSVGTLEMLYGVDIPYYVRMNFTGFVGIVDALGGVDVYSDSAFTVGEEFAYTEGVNQMSGIEALAFARERYTFTGGDRARGTHQMEVIKAVLNKCASSSILYNYADVMNSMSGCFTTNMPKDKIASLVRMQLSDMAQWNITAMSVDGIGASKTTYSVPGKKAYVMIPDENTIKQAKENIAALLSGQ